MEDLRNFEYDELLDAMEYATLPMHWENGSGIIIWANKAELALLGYDEDEYVGKHISNFHADREVIDDILARLINKEELVNYEARLKCRNGYTKEVLINTNVYWKDDRIFHARCYTTDITDLKEEDRRKAKLIQSLDDKIKSTDERFSKMVSEVEDYAIILLDKDGTILNWNKGAERIKGYKEKDIVGQNFRIFYLPQDRQNMLPERLIYEAVDKGRAKHEGFRVRSDGTTFWGTIIITALHDDKGNIIGFTKVTRDLTEKPNSSQEEHFDKEPKVKG
jgi:PAS domain S-box-containing protein